MNLRTIVMIGALGLFGVAGCSEDTARIKANYGYVKQPAVVLHVPSSYNFGSSFTMVDWDHDGDPEFLAAEKYGKIFIYDTINGKLCKSEKPIMEVPADYAFGPAFCAYDRDNDGQIEIFAADKDGKIHEYRQSQPQ